MRVLSTRGSEPYGIDDVVCDKRSQHSQHSQHSQSQPSQPTQPSHMKPEINKSSCPDDDLIYFPHVTDMFGQRIRFFGSNVNPPLVFRWPNGLEWNCTAVYFHDMTCAPDEIPEDGEHSAELVKLAVENLRKNIEAASGRLLTWYNGHGDNVWCVGGTYEVTIGGRYIAFFVRQNDVKGQVRAKRYLLAQIYE